jgi:hypothetical protein
VVADSDPTRSSGGGGGLGPGSFVLRSDPRSFHSLVTVAVAFARTLVRLRARTRARPLISSRPRSLREHARLVYPPRSLCTRRPSKYTRRLVRAFSFGPFLTHSFVWVAFLRALGPISLARTNLTRPSFARTNPRYVAVVAVGGALGPDSSEGVGGVRSDRSRVTPSNLTSPLARFASPLGVTPSLALASTPSEGTLASTPRFAQTRLVYPPRSFHSLPKDPAPSYPSLASRATRRTDRSRLVRPSLGPS